MSHAVIECFYMGTVSYKSRSGRVSHVNMKDYCKPSTIRTFTVGFGISPNRLYSIEFADCHRRLRITLDPEEFCGAKIQKSFIGVR